MSELRVLLTTYGFPDYRQAFIERYVLALIALGNDVCVVATAGTGRVPERNTRAFTSPRLTVVQAPWTDARGKKVVTLLGSLIRSARHHPRALRKLVTALRRRHRLRHALLAELYVLTPILSRPVDVVHRGWLPAATHWAELMALIDAPLVVRCHGSDLRIDPLLGDQYRQALTAVFERADLVHCVSEDLARHALALGLAPSKAFVCPWGVDTTYFQPAASREPGARSPNGMGTVHVVSVGRLHWVKGYEFALQAIAQLRRVGVDIDYTIVGFSEERELLALLTTVRDLGLEPHVSVRGALPPDGVLDALRAADIFMLPSLSEGLSIATLEAMAVGLPVVVTDVGGMREAVTDGVEGRVVPARDPAALADALLELVNDAKLRASMGERGRRRAIDEFDSEKCARALLEQYQRLVRERPRAGARSVTS